MLRTITFAGIGELATHLIPWCEANDPEENTAKFTSLEDLLGMHRADRAPYDGVGAQLGDMDICIYCGCDIELQTVDLIMEDLEVGQQSFTRDVWVAFQPVLIQEFYP